MAASMIGAGTGRTMIARSRIAFCGRLQPVGPQLITAILKSLAGGCEHRLPTNRCGGLMWWP